LEKYCIHPITVFTVKKEDVIHHNYRYRKYSSLELLEILEGMLKEIKISSTGLDLYTLPDREWLQNCILYLNPSDPYELLEPKSQSNPYYTLKINEE
jgi:hypothetical protein